MVIELQLSLVVIKCVCCAGLECRRLVCDDGVAKRASPCVVVVVVVVVVVAASVCVPVWW
jgi:hypothetical protein